MIVRDCPWERENLGKRTVEMTVQKGDVFDASALRETCSPFQYAVVKVPACMPSFNFGLTELGFTMLETQINLSKRYSDFDFEDRLVKQILPHLGARPVETEEALERLLARITPSMFSTDRIFLDPAFPAEAGARRYANWVRAEFNRRTGIIREILYDADVVGFSLCREDPEHGTFDGLLGGLFEEYQSMGLGFITAAFPFLQAYRENRPFRILRTSISANNMPVLQFYNYLHYRVDGVSYVFVKHFE